MNLIRVIIFLFFISLMQIAQGQYKPPSQRQSSNYSGTSVMDKVYFGGGGGFSGGSGGYRNVSISPLIGYKFTEEFSAGMQLSYQAIRIGNGAKARAYGGGPFLRYNVTEQLFAYSQYEYLRYEDNISLDPSRTFNSLFAGIGYSEPINSKLAFNITALYNFMYGDGSNTPYDSPLVFRVGIVGGLF